MIWYEKYMVMKIEVWVRPRSWKTGQIFFNRLKILI